MSDTATLSALIIGSTALVGLLLKVLHSMRNDIKSCGWNCITFRTPDNSVAGSPPQQVPTIPTVPISDYKFPPV